MDDPNSNVWLKNRRFYEEHVAGMIRDRFGLYESRIAVGLSGEGSDCFGFDDEISRDHDFGTGVCLWLTDEDMHLYGQKRKGHFIRRDCRNVEVSCPFMIFIPISCRSIAIQSDAR